MKTLYEISEVLKCALDTLHLWMQIVGKVKLELAPFLNQWWEVGFLVTAQGITTGIIPYSRGAFEIIFDFLNHKLTILTSNNQCNTILLAPCSVAEFYHEFFNALTDLSIHIAINVTPVEIPDMYIRFTEDRTHAAYDKDYVTRWWRILLKNALVFDSFRTAFRGKSSPTQFYWGSFDLNETRFSGNPAPPPKMKGAMGKIMRYAENEENFSFGFWPGDSRYPHPAFYAYIYPTPQGMEKISFDEGASFNEQLSECILPYDAVREADNPEENILHFLDTIYHESATLAGWNIQALENESPFQQGNTWHKR